MNYMDGGEWLSGPAFAKWFEPFTRSRIERSPVRESLRKCMRDWKRGGAVEIAAADRYLVAFDLHIALVPDYIWLPQEDWPRSRPAPKPKPRPKPRTHCRNGHKYTRVNTGFSGGKRVCLACRQLRYERRNGYQGGRLSSAPLAAWLIERHDELGSWEKVAQRLGLSISRVHELATEHVALVNRGTVERILGDEAGCVYSDAFPQIAVSEGECSSAANAQSER